MFLYKLVNALVLASLLAEGELSTEEENSGIMSRNRRKNRNRNRAVSDFISGKINRRKEKRSNKIKNKKHKHRAYVFTTLGSRSDTDK